MRVGLVGAIDRHIEDALRQAGVQVTSLAVADLPILAQPEAKVPDALVLDLRNESTFPPVVASLKRQHPSVGMVIVAARHEPGLMIEAMRAGVSEWVVEPVTGPELKSAVDRVVDHGLASKPVGKIFAFLGAKGGVGTTTIAVNIATALTRLASARTLVMDLHLAYGDAALFLGAEPRFSIVDAIENRHRLDEAFFRGLLTKTKAGPDLLASSDRPMVGAVDARGIGAVIEFAARLYPYVVLDVPRSDSTILDALEIASNLTVVANQELATLRSASRLASALRQRYGRNRVSVVVSRYDKLAAIGKDDVARVVGGAIGHLFPSDYRLAVEALNVGRPLVMENHSRLSASYVGFARSLAEFTEDSERPTRPRGLFGKFGARR